jgi:hypothetical protein
MHSSCITLLEETKPKFLYLITLDSSISSINCSPCMQVQEGSSLRSGILHCINFKQINFINVLSIT